MEELQRIAVTENAKPALTTVRIDRKDDKPTTINANDSVTNTNNKRPPYRVTCSICKKSIFRDHRHCKACGNHILKSAEDSQVSAKVQQALKAMPYNEMKDLVVYNSGCGTTTFNHAKWFKTLEPLPIPTTNLSSSGDLTRDQSNNVLIHQENGQTLAEMQRYNNVPTIRTKPATTTPSVPTSLLSVPYRKMHRRLMHTSKPVVEEACKRAGIVITAKDDSFCEGCIMGKATDQLGKEAPIQGNGPFNFVRVDLVTHKNPRHLGYRYSIQIIDV
ncbi:hypothetical protein MMYC01_201624 [Madurella mycetomatis]|nr:hypothetical protein MMYC01_201624 [Madurella mycetomatis]